MSKQRDPNAVSWLNLMLGTSIVIGVLGLTWVATGLWAQYIARPTASSESVAQFESPALEGSDSSEIASPHQLQATPELLLLTPETARHKEVLPVLAGEVARPTRLLCQNDQLYFLARGQLYRTDVEDLPHPRTLLMAESLMPNREHRLPSGERIRELLDLGQTDGESLLALDKSNDLYRFTPTSRHWEFAHKAQATGKEPEPHYVALANWQERAYLLDYASNQIWRYSAGALSPYFAPTQRRELSKALDLHIDGKVYVLLRNGEIWRYNDGQAEAQPLVKIPALVAHRSPAFRSLRGDATHLYVVDAGSRRIVQISKASGKLGKQWVLAGEAPEWERLHDLVFCQNQLLALAGNELVLLPGQSQVKSALLPPAPKVLLPALSQFELPIPELSPADNPGIFPGARRLYRYGIHEGLDFFDRTAPQAGGKQVHIGTPVLAIGAGEVLRADQDFKELSPAAYQDILASCEQAHETSREHENLLRGRQVWIRHADGITSLYAHLSSIPAGLQVGQSVEQGQVIGQVGNSGTSSGIAGKPDWPHLHLELWLGDPNDPQGEYLGKWLSLEETRELWQQVLGWN